MATSLPPSPRSIPDCLLSPSLPSAGFAEAIHRRYLRFLVPAGHGEGWGSGGGAAQRGRGGGGRSLWGMCGGGGDAPSSSRLLPSLTLPGSSLPSQGFSLPSAASSGPWECLSPLPHVTSVVILAHTTQGWPHTSHHAQIALWHSLQVMDSPGSLPALFRRPILPLTTCVCVRESELCHQSSRTWHNAARNAHTMHYVCLTSHLTYTSRIIPFTSRTTRKRNLSPFGVIHMS